MPPAIEWQKCFGGSGDDGAYSIRQTNDGGFIMCGSTTSDDGQVVGTSHNLNGLRINRDFWIVKMNSAGMLQWQKRLGGTNDDVALSVQQTSDNGYIVAGWTQSDDGDLAGLHIGNSDYWILKLDSQGNTQWSKCFGGSLVDIANSIQQTADGGYIVAGSSQSTNGDVTGNHPNNFSSTTDCWIIKLNNAGTIEWQKSLGGSGEDIASSIKQTADGGYIVGGVTSSPDGDVTAAKGYNDFWVIKLDNTGKIQWQKALGGTGDDGASSIQPCTDGGYIVAGYSNSTDGNVTGNHGGGFGGYDYWIVKTDATGNIVWQKSLGGTSPDKAQSIGLTSDGGYIVVGDSNSQDGDAATNHGTFYGNNDYWIIKLNAAGNIEWQRSIGGSDTDRAYSIEQTANNGFIIAGYTNSFNGDITGKSPGSDCWIVRLNAAPCLPSISIANASNSICAGSPATFTATEFNGGSNPAYQWKRNGINTGTNSSSYSSTTLNNGDRISCVLSSNAVCATTTVVTSDTIIVQISQPPVANLITSGGNCLGASTLIVRTADTLSTITWYHNNLPVQTTAATSAATSGITVAGGNGQGAAGNQLSSPWTVFVDGSQNVYVADADNKRIQKWAPGATSGITVVDDNGAVNQMVPYGVYVDKSDNIYVANFVTHRIQKWLPAATTGITVAGGNGQGAAADQFNSPVGVYVDAAGNLYVTDYNNNRIHKWLFNATSGMTIAGGNGAGPAASQLDHPNGDVNVDANGNVYIADGGNYRVVKWAPGATVGVTVAGGNGAGSAANQLNGVGGIFVDAAGNIYIADASNHRVQKWAPGATSGVTVAGGNGQGSAANQLKFPNDVFVAANGDMYIADFYNFRIQKWVQQSTIDSTYKPLQPGSYTAMVTNVAGCTFTTNAVVIQPSLTPAVSITASATSVCEGSPITFTAIPANGGAAPAYQWKINGTAAGSGGNTFTTTALHHSDTVTCILTSNAVTCLTSSTATSNNIVVSVIPTVTPAVTISSNPAIVCAATPVTFTATPVNGGAGPTFQWQLNGKNVAGNAAAYTPGNLTGGDKINVVLTSNASCLTSPTVTSNSMVVNMPVVSTVTIAAAATTICKGANATFTATAANEGPTPVYQWKINGINTGGNNSVFATRLLQNSDQVTCTLTGILPCSAPVNSNSITISVASEPGITIRPDTAIMYGGQVVLTTSATDIISAYKWSPSAGLSSDTGSHPVASPSTTTTYTLLATSPQGCIAQKQVTITVNQVVRVTNAFSPNGDGINDVWTIPGIAAFPASTVEVFDRYGSLIFRSVGYNKPWDGTHKGKALPVGTYYYIVDTKSKGQPIAGWVAILK